MSQRKLHEYRKLKKAGRFHGTLKRAKALLNHRQEIALDEVDTIEEDSRSRLVPIPLGYHKSSVGDIARQAYPRRKRWEEPVADTTSKSVGVESIVFGRYGPHYTMWSYRPTYRSCGFCTETRLLFFFGPHYWVIRPSRGWIFLQSTAADIYRNSLHGLARVQVAPPAIFVTRRKFRNWTLKWLRFSASDLLPDFSGQTRPRFSALRDEAMTKETMVASHYARERLSRSRGKLRDVNDAINVVEDQLAERERTLESSRRKLLPKIVKAAGRKIRS